MEASELECGLCTHSTPLPPLAQQEPVSMEYKFTHEWKDKCLAEESDGKRWVEGARCKSTEII